MALHLGNTDDKSSVELAPAASESFTEIANKQDRDSGTDS